VVIVGVTGYIYPKLKKLLGGCVLPTYYHWRSRLCPFELSKKFEFHYTPLKGSWLNMVEIEISALSRQCLNRRISDIKKMAKEVSA